MNKSILKLLEKHVPFDESERESLEKIKQLAKDNPLCFENNFFVPGHITGSALVVDKNLEHVLLNHHLVIDKWFQFGGHSDDHPVVQETAFREAREESGLKNLKFAPQVSGIFDVDVHPIPEKNDKPKHFHYDVRFLLIGDFNEKFVVSNESKEIKWVKSTEMKKYSSEPAFLRMIEKVKLLATGK